MGVVLTSRSIMLGDVTLELRDKATRIQSMSIAIKLIINECRATV
jgi:hypothetical protein